MIHLSSNRPNAGRHRDNAHRRCWDTLKVALFWVDSSDTLRHVILTRCLADIASDAALGVSSGFVQLLARVDIALANCCSLHSWSPFSSYSSISFSLCAISGGLIYHSLSSYHYYVCSLCICLTFSSSSVRRRQTRLSMDGCTSHCRRHPPSHTLPILIQINCLLYL